MFSQLMVLLFGFLLTTCSSSPDVTSEASQDVQIQQEQKVPLESLSRAYFGSGCFWCVEAIYESVRGVHEAVSGYAGGFTENPTYEEVGSKRTGHAEVVEVYYDPEIIDFASLVKVYYGSQNPTTVGQHPDYGSAYRSIIFYQNEEEKKIAEEAKESIAGEYKDPIVTEILAFEKFWKAEEYHQDFEKRNPNQRYVRAVSIPRLNRFKEKFPDLIK